MTAGESGAVGVAGLLAAAKDQMLRAELNLNAEANVLVIGTEGATDPQLYQSLLTPSD